MLLCSESGRSMVEPAEIKAHVRRCKTCRPLLPLRSEATGEPFDPETSAEAREARRPTAEPKDSARAADHAAAAA